MASRFAEQLIKASLKAGTEQSWAATAMRIDTELAEVREVLDGLQTFQMNLDSECTERHWCQPNGGCNEHCQRTRALYERLQP